LGTTRAATLPPRQRCVLGHHQDELVAALQEQQEQFQLQEQEQEQEQEQL